MTTETRQLIDAYVIANEKRLKNLCRKFYGGHNDWEDLFQEFYIRLVGLKQDYFDRIELSKLCYWTIYNLYSHRHRSSSKLKRATWVEVKDYMLTEEVPYTRDIEEFIDAELAKPHGFAAMSVFMQSLEEPLRSIERKTGINICALSKYRKQGQLKLQSLCS